MKAIVNVPVCALMTEPTRSSTLSDEALYGMVVEIVKAAAPGWVLVRTHYRYEGYAALEDLLLGDDLATRWEQLPKKVILNKNSADVLSAPKVQGWHMQHLVRGCVAAPVGDPTDGWQQVLLADGRSGYIQSSILGEYYASPLSENEDELRKAICDRTLLYLGTHYRWGGKSPEGIDCSGLCSMAYLLCGIVIYRDADILPDFPIHEIALEDIKPGDVLLFPGHIAMYLGDGRYCHSTGRAGDDGVVINSLNPAHPDYRDDLAHRITQVGSYFPVQKG